jgi:hypothetical protein
MERRAQSMVWRKEPSGGGNGGLNSRALDTAVRG